MKRKITVIIFITVTVLILASSIFHFERVGAQVAGGSYALEWINHRVEVMYDGYIFVNDTIKIKGAISDGFFMGLPSQYGPFVLRCVAYNPTNPAEKYAVTTNVSLANRAGFYGVKVGLPQQEIQIFTVGFLLSNSLLRQDAQNTSLYVLSFPAYPSLTTMASVCNASIILPQNAQYVNGTVEGLTYSKSNLPAFAYEPANVTFKFTGYDMQLLTVEKMRREIKIGGLGEIEVSDSYYVTNHSPEEMTFAYVVLPPNASDVTLEDEFGRKAKTSPVLANLEINLYRAVFVLPLKSGRSTMFNVKYTLPKTCYIKQNGSEGLEFALPVFKNLNCYIEQASLTIVLPEGAKTLSCKGDSPAFDFDIAREGFQEKLTANMQKVFFLDAFTVKLVYQYNPLWLAFRPTLWAWVLAVFICAIAVVVKRPKVPAPAPAVVPAVAAKFSPEDVRAFVSSYEEKQKIVLEMEALEAGLRRGRIPRRRYKVQKRTLETRLETLSRGLEDLKQKLLAAGGRHADLMHQFEAAEAEVNAAEENMRNIEVHHRRGELSLEDYRKLLEEYERKKENAETKINGILMRLREEIR